MWYTCSVRYTCTVRCFYTWHIPFKWCMYIYCMDTFAYILYTLRDVYIYIHIQVLSVICVRCVGCAKCVLFCADYVLYKYVYRVYIYYMLGIFVYMEFVCVLGVNIGILAQHVCHLCRRMVYGIQCQVCSFGYIGK